MECVRISLFFGYYYCLVSDFKVYVVKGIYVCFHYTKMCFNSFWVSLNF
jgi:hypothetical protein